MASKRLQFVYLGQVSTFLSCFIIILDGLEDHLIFLEQLEVLLLLLDCWSKLIILWID